MNRGDEFFAAWEGWLEKVDNVGLGKPTPRKKDFRPQDWLRGLPRVAMMQTTDLGRRKYPAASGRFHGP